MTARGIMRRDLLKQGGAAAGAAGLAASGLELSRPPRVSSGRQATPSARRCGSSRGSGPPMTPHGCSTASTTPTTSSTTARSRSSCGPATSRAWRRPGCASRSRSRTSSRATPRWRPPPGRSALLAPQPGETPDGQYRVLDDSKRELKELADRFPDKARVFQLPEASREGRTI